MKSVFWKYEIPDQTKFELDMPDKAKIIKVDVQMIDGKETPCFWALVPVFDIQIIKRKFVVITTGEPFQTN